MDHRVPRARQVQALSLASTTSLSAFPRPPFHCPPSRLQGSLDREINLIERNLAARPRFHKHVSPEFIVPDQFVEGYARSGLSWALPDRLEFQDAPWAQRQAEHFNRWRRKSMDPAIKRTAEQLNTSEALRAFALGNWRRSSPEQPEHQPELERDDEQAAPDNSDSAHHGLVSKPCTASNDKRGAERGQEPEQEGSPRSRHPDNIAAPEQLRSGEAASRCEVTGSAVRGSRNVHASTKGSGAFVHNCLQPLLRRGKCRRCKHCRGWLIAELDHPGVSP